MALKEKGTDFFSDALGNNDINDDGHLVRDATVASRCRRRLMIRRGEWVGDPDLGSRLHEITTTKQAQREAEGIIREALQPMIDDGSITEIIVGEDLVIDHAKGHVGIFVEIVVAGDEQVPLGTFLLGGPR